MIASILVALALVLPAAAQTWNVNANGNWNNNANWTPAAFPNAIGASGTFGSIITANRTITFGTNVTVGNLSFNDNNRYTIQGANQLTFDVAAGNATLSATGNNHILGGTSGSTFLLNDTVASAQTLRRRPRA